MDVKFTNAASAYADALNRAAQSRSDSVELGLGGADKAAGPSFSDLLQDVATQSIDSMRAGETVSMRAAGRQTELVDVVTAVTNAEVSLQTVVAVRDRVIQAYQDIVRMPI